MIQPQEVEEAQKRWAQALVHLSSFCHKHLDPSQRYHEAEKVLEELYDFKNPFAFKPTLAHGAKTFRLTKSEALFYFIKSDDAGFALKNWKEVHFHNAQILRYTDHAVAMGRYLFTPHHSSQTTTVEYTFVYQKNPNHELKIIAHHSSLPYNP